MKNARCYKRPRAPVDAPPRPTPHQIGVCYLCGKPIMDSESSHTTARGLAHLRHDYQAQVPPPKPHQAHAFPLTRVAERMKMDPTEVQSFIDVVTGHRYVGDAADIVIRRSDLEAWLRALPRLGWEPGDGMLEPLEQLLTEE